MPGPGHYWIADEEREEVLDVLNAGYLSRYGDPDDPKFRRKVYMLEREFAAYSGVKHCVATSSGTGSLYIALKALGIGPGDEVIVPAYTFVASYTAVIFAGAAPVLSEIDQSLTLDPGDVENRITKNTRAIMPVHVLGNPADLDAICGVARKHGLYVVEDSCQAAGASYKGRKVGSIGEIGGFSLNFYKTITAGDGGLVITDDDDLYWRAFAIHDQGHTPNRTGLEIGTRSIIGFNFRINELTAAVALAQLRKLDRITARLKANKARVKQLLGDLPGVSFRKLNDREGECGTLLTLIFDSREKARAVATRLGTKTLDNSGWPVYFNMEQIQQYFHEQGRELGRGSYPATDDILERSVNVSVGVVDPGIGSAFGINIDSSDDEIEERAAELRGAIVQAQ
jgi:dTDP-4-amino-4,6-dideoxygalactose transaminase